MATQWMRRACLAAACASAMLLAACGSSTTESAITPDRFIAFGDALSDAGQNGMRYTVNDGTSNNWTLELASRYGKTLTASNAGGNSYAVGNARIALKPDAAGNASTPTVTEQIDKFLASGSFSKGDVVLVGGGASDLIANMAAVLAGTMSEDDYLAAARTAAQALAAQTRRLVTAGAPHVLLTSTYDLGKTPWAKRIGREALLSQAASRFNEALLVAVVDLGANVLYVDLAYQLNLFINTPGSYAISNTDTPICTSVDAGAGIGTGAGQLNSALCTTATLTTSKDYERYLFADGVYLGTNAQRQIGYYAYDRLHTRW